MHCFDDTSVGLSIVNECMSVCWDGINKCWDYAEETQTKAQTDLDLCK